LKPHPYKLSTVTPGIR